MKKTTKKTAVAVVGILSAVAVGSGVAALNANNGKSVLANGNVAYAAEAATQTELQKFVASLQEIASTVNAYADDTAFFDMATAANKTAAQKAYVLHGQYILNLSAADRVALETTNLTYEDGVTVKYATAAALYNKLEAVYGDYYAILANLKGYVNGSGSAITAKTLSWGEKAEVEGFITAYDSLEANKQATVDVFATIDNKPVANIKTAITGYYTALNTKIETAEAAMTNLYKHDNGDETYSVVLGSNDSEYAASQNKTTLTQVLGAIELIYGAEGSGLPSVTKADDERVYAVVNAYNEAKAEYDAIFTGLQAIAEFVDGVYEGFNADTACLTYNFEEAGTAGVAYDAGANKITVAANYVATLVDSDDNKIATEYAKLYEQTAVAQLKEMVAAQTDSQKKVNDLIAEITVIEGYTDDTLYTTNRQAVSTARSNFEALPSEIKAFHVKGEDGKYVTLTEEQIAAIEKYITNYSDLLDAEQAIADMDVAVQELKDYVLSFDGIYKAGGFSKDFNIQYQADFAALISDQQLAITTGKISQEEGALTYEQEAQRVFDLYDETLTVVGPIIAKINNLPLVEEVTIDDSAEILAVYNEFQALSPEYQNYVTNSATLMAVYNELSGVRTDLSAWNTAVGALTEKAELTVADKAAIDAVHKTYTEFSTQMQSYIKAATAESDKDTYDAYTKYVAVYSAMYDDKDVENVFGVVAEADGIWTQVVDTATMMEQLPVLAPDANNEAIADFNTKYAAVKTKYNALPEASQAQVQVYNKVLEEDTYGKGYANYLSVAYLGDYYYWEAQVEDINVAFGGTATTYTAEGVATITAAAALDLGAKDAMFDEADYAACTYDIEVFAVIYEKVMGTAGYYATNDVDVTAEGAKLLRNHALLVDLKAKYDAFIAKYATYNTTIRSALTQDGEEGADYLKKIELSGGEGYAASIANMEAFFTPADEGTLTADEVAYMGYQYHLYLTEAAGEADADAKKLAIETVKNVINTNLAAVNTEINRIIEAATANTLVDSDIASMNAILNDYDNVYCATQAAEIENIEQLTSAQNTSALVNYIKASIDEITANVEAGKLTSDGAALVQVLNILYTNQTAQIKTLVGTEYEAKLAALVAAYEAEGVIVDVTDVKAALEAAKQEFTDAIADTNGALAEAVADIETLIEGVAQNGADIEALEGNVADITADITGITSEIDAMNSEIAYLQTTIQDAISAYKANAAEGYTLADVLADANARITKLTADLVVAKDALAAKDAELQVAIAAVDTAVKALDAEYTAFVAKYDVEVAGIKTSITEIKSDVEAQIADISEELAATKKALEEKDAQLKSEINKLVADLEAAVATLEAADAELKAEIKNLEGSLGDLKSSLTATIIVFSILLAGAVAAIVLLFLKKQGK